ncbi:carbonic anhydrase [Natronosalvus vescus]|uniref:carbonic anhydrase n=1 Tax=Natronosalvus vescus TaxID=2953881 RepID=UPI00209117AC|nr:carbonic anhydrase [Natronosalvus vescus]
MPTRESNQTTPAGSDADSTEGTDGDAPDPDEILVALLEGNDSHVDGLPGDYFDPVREEQHPDVVTICCADSRVSQEGMWAVDRPGAVFTPSNIGNQAWDDHEGEKIVDGSLLYPVYYADTDAIAIVGHTGCGAVTAAYDVANGNEPPGPAGVSKWVEMLVPVIEDGLESDLIDADAERPIVINQLVEYNVDRQAAFLHAAETVPDSVAIYGFVYDFHGVYGSDAGRAHLVNLNGETSPENIIDQLPDAYAKNVGSLLY